MVSLRFRPEWFKARTTLGYGKDWPIDWRDMWTYYRQAEEALSISGPVTYPWGPHRPRYPYRPHPMNAAAEVLARGCEAMGMKWTPTPLSTVSAPRGKAHPCVYRGFCRFGCSTNAKQSALTVWVPRAITAGAEIRDLAMVGRIETDARGLATGLHYHREGQWRFQKARNVVVAGYAVETPRLLLMSANDRFRDGLANSSGLVGKNLMTQPNQAVFGRSRDEIRWSKGPPSLAITEHWNYDDRKDFHGGYCWMGQGPLPIEWMKVQTGARGLWGEALRTEMMHYNHQVGVKMVGECLPREENRVELAEETDQYGLPITKITFGWGENDRALIDHALDQMQMSMEAAGVTDLFRQDQDANHLGGTAPMGDDRRQSVVDADCRSWDIPNLWVLRRLGVPDGRRRQSGPHHPGSRNADRRSDRGVGAARGAVGGRRLQRRSIARSRCSDAMKRRRPSAPPRPQFAQRSGVGTLPSGVPSSAKIWTPLFDVVQIQPRRSTVNPSGMPGPTMRNSRRPDSAPSRPMSNAWISCFWPPSAREVSET